MVMLSRWTSSTWIVCNEQFGDVWLNLGSIDGTLYSVFPRAAIKSLVWYSPPAFEAAGYEVPTTWDELLALCDQIVDDGCIVLLNRPGKRRGQWLACYRLD